MAAEKRAVLVSAFAFGICVSARDARPPRPVYTPEAMLKRISTGAAAAAQGAQGSACVLPDNTAHGANARLTVDGQTYRCVEVLDGNLQPGGVAWTRMPVYTSEAMLRRIGGGAVPANRADRAGCALPNGSARAVDTTVTAGGRTYRCVEILDRNLQPRGAAWTPVAPQP